MSGEWFFRQHCHRAEHAVNKKLNLNSESGDRDYLVVECPWCYGAVRSSIVLQCVLQCELKSAIVITNHVEILFNNFIVNVLVGF